MSKPRRLQPYRPVKPLPAGKPLAPYRSPDIPAGKFRHCTGQQAMDFGSDDPDVLADPQEGQS